MGMMEGFKKATPEEIAKDTEKAERTQTPAQSEATRNRADSLLDVYDRSNIEPEILIERAKNSDLTLEGDTELKNGSVSKLKGHIKGHEVDLFKTRDDDFGGTIDGIPLEGDEAQKVFVGYFDMVKIQAQSDLVTEKSIKARDIELENKARKEQILKDIL